MRTDTAAQRSNDIGTLQIGVHSTRVGDVK